MLCFILLLGPLAMQAPADSAAQLLTKAEEQAAEGYYEKALRTYREIREHHPDTEEAAIAERRTQPSAFVGWADLVRHGPSANRVDIVLMGDGYTLGHQKAFDDLADDIPPLFERQRTFREYYPYLNFVRASMVSADSGVDGFGREYDTALGAYTLATDRGHVGIDPREVREALAELPEHDGLAVVFVKNGVSGTGLPGIATIGGRNARTTIHEWGHAFADLGDEYATHTHDRGVPRQRVNVAITEDPEKVPWAHWLLARVPDIGIYEGASGQVRGAWKPTPSGCLMNNAEFFCRVCREALLLRIYSIVDPIESHSPEVIPVESGVSYRMRDDPLVFRVRVMRPESHHLEVRWWLLRENEAPRRGGSAMGGRYGPTGNSGDRHDRGELHPILIDPISVKKHEKSGEHELVIKPSRKLEPGRYRVVCRAEDTTLLRGEKWPWVLKDPADLLQSERAWWIEIPPRNR